MPDIDMETDGLKQFASRPELTLHVENIAPFAATAAAMTGGLPMPEGAALRRTDQATTDRLMTCLTAVNQGMTGYRSGANWVATHHEQNEDRLRANLNRIQPGLPAVADEFTADIAKDRAADQGLRRAQ